MKLTESDIAFCKLMANNNKNAGQIVVTKTNKTGRIYNNEEPINGKIRVYLVDGSKMLCSPENLKVVGFVD